MPKMSVRENVVAPNNSSKFLAPFQFGSYSKHHQLYPQTSIHVSQRDHFYFNLYAVSRMVSLEGVFTLAKLLVKTSPISPQNYALQLHFYSNLAFLWCYGKTSLLASVTLVKTT
jgi:hypothetical protein